MSRPFAQQLAEFIGQKKFDKQVATEACLYYISNYWLLKRRIRMSTFASKPPSKTSKHMGNFFRGGLMPGAPVDRAALLIFDIRNLKLSAAQGRQLEAAVREFIFAELRKHTDLSDRSAVDLSKSVFGIVIE
jgi:hypothetical protein